MVFHAEDYHNWYYYAAQVSENPKTISLNKHSKATTVKSQSRFLDSGIQYDNLCKQPNFCGHIVAKTHTTETRATNQTIEQPVNQMVTLEP